MATASKKTVDTPRPAVLSPRQISRTMPYCKVQCQYQQNQPQSPTPPQLQRQQQANNKLTTISGHNKVSAVSTSLLNCSDFILQTEAQGSSEDSNNISVNNNNWGMGFQRYPAAIAESQKVLQENKRNSPLPPCTSISRMQHRRYNSQSQAGGGGDQQSKYSNHLIKELKQQLEFLSSPEPDELALLNVGNNALGHDRRALRQKNIDAVTDNSRQEDFELLNDTDIFVSKVRFRSIKQPSRQGRRRAGNALPPYGAVKFHENLLRQNTRQRPKTNQLFNNNGNGNNSCNGHQHDEKSDTSAYAQVQQQQRLELVLLKNSQAGQFIPANSQLHTGNSHSGRSQNNEFDIQKRSLSGLRAPLREDTLTPNDQSTGVSALPQVLLLAGVGSEHNHQQQQQLKTRNRNGVSEPRERPVYSIKRSQDFSRFMMKLHFNEEKQIYEDPAERGNKENNSERQRRIRSYYEKLSLNSLLTMEKSVEDQSVDKTPQPAAQADENSAREALKMHSLALNNSNNNNNNNNCQDEILDVRHACQLEGSTEIIKPGIQRQSSNNTYYSKTCQNGAKKGHRKYSSRSNAENTFAALNRSTVKNKHDGNSFLRSPSRQAQEHFPKVL